MIGNDTVMENVKRSNIYGGGAFTAVTRNQMDFMKMSVNTRAIVKSLDLNEELGQVGHYGTLTRNQMDFNRYWG